MYYYRTRNSLLPLCRAQRDAPLWCRWRMSRTMCVYALGTSNATRLHVTFDNTVKR